jgi:photosystem II stability/assembly factor-like uncharacterized protein
MHVQTPIADLVKGISLPTSSVIVVVGEGGAIARSTDAGMTWSTQTSGVSHDLWSVHFWSADSGIAVGDEGTILTTYDAGASWTPRQSGMTAGSARFLFHATSVGDRLVVVGGEVASYSASILTSTDRGLTWSKRNLSQSIFLDRIAFIDASTAITVGMSQAMGGGIYRTTDGGASWTSVHSAAQLVTAVAASGDRVVAVGSGGMVYTSSDRGATWSESTALPGADLLDVALDGRGNGIAVGGMGVTLVSSDGGGSWTHVPIQGGGFLSDVAFDPSGASAFAVGPAGAVYRSAIAAHVDQRVASKLDIRVAGREIIIDAAVRSSVDISIHDVLGRTIASTKTADHTRLSVPSAGRYLIVVRNGSKSEVRGVVVMQ